MNLKKSRTVATAVSLAAAVGGSFLVSAHAQAPSWPMTPGQTQPMNTPGPGQAFPTTPGLPGNPAPGHASGVMPAGSSIAGHTLSELAGKPLRGAGQQELGQVSDVLIDPQTGRVAFIVVPSGAGSQGQTYRLVPVEALDATSNAQGLRTHVAAAQWQQVGTLAENRIQGRVTLDPGFRSRLQQQFGLSQPLAQNAEAALVRATALRGKPLRSGNEQLGTIQDVAVDLAHRYAVAVVDASAAGASGPQLVSFQQLQLGDDLANVTTSLTRASFQGGSNQAGLPTGPSGPFAGATPAGFGPVIAVRQALDQNASVSGASVQVVPEPRVALFGTVASEQMRSEIERIAKEAAPGVPILNHLAVQPK